MFDRRALIVGSMNYDAPSRWLNTEVGLIVRSPDLAGQTPQRFQAMTQPASAHTVKQSQPVSYHTEPARGAWQRFKVRSL